MLVIYNIIKKKLLNCEISKEKFKMLSIEKIKLVKV